MERVICNNSNSGNIISYGYSEDTQVLEIEFSAKNGAGSSVYQYGSVPAEKWRELLQATSAGNYINSNIKPYYLFKRVKAG